MPKQYTVGEVKAISQDEALMATLPADLQEKIREIFSGCNCKLQQKVAAIMPQLREAFGET